MPTRVLATVVAAVSTFAVLAACSSSVVSGSPGSSGGSSSPSTVTRTPSKPAPDLKAQLLTVGNLPSGWAVDNSSDSGGASTPSCLKNLKATMHSLNETEADFVKGTDFPQFGQQIAYFGTASTALQKFSAGVAIVDACKDISFTTDGHKIKGSIGTMSFPAVGDRSHAWNLVLSAEGINVGFYVVYVQKGAELENLVYGDLGTPDLDEYTTLVNAAVAKMP